MSDLQDMLLSEFQQIQGAMTESTEAWSLGGSGGAISGGQRDTAPRGNVDALGDQTGAIDYGRSSSSSNSSAGGTLNDLEGIFAGGLGLVPLGLELASIFGGGSSTPPPLTRYAMPDSIGFIGSTDDAGGPSDADFSQTGQPRSYGTPSSQYSATAMVDGGSTPNSGPSQPIQINVQAMDAQSFMDRSDDIAAAVNKAILSLHPIADTISNL
ncbi:MAG TPA: hypothetical protein VMB03_13285 [Bryobacteraceae bacterium]|nr:hypothetical protein [Bryobacteraceae bacterium]